MDTRGRLCVTDDVCDNECWAGADGTSLEPTGSCSLATAATCTMASPLSDADKAWVKWWANKCLLAMDGGLGCVGCAACPVALANYDEAFPSAVDEEAGE